MAEPTGPKPPNGPTLLGAQVDVEVTAVAHGGHCVARLDDAAAGRVVFVRHALPGERVRVLITEDGGGAFCRGDAVEILRPAEGRVPAPCPHAGPGRCGGCDWQHVDAAGQRRLKADVVREQFRRLAGLDVDVDVEPLPGGPLGWRTRTLYSADAQGRLGLRRHRSHEVEVLASCPLAVDGVGNHPRLAEAWPGARGVEFARGDDGESAILLHQPAPRRGASRIAARPDPRRGRRPPDRISLVEGPARLRHQVAGVSFEVSAGGFWQVHPAAASTLSSAVLEGLGPQPGERVLDLYAGSGLFTALLAGAVGERGRVLGVESSRQGAADGAANLAGFPWAELRCASVSARQLGELDLIPDLVVLDPPRAGAGVAVMNALLDLAPRAMAYVSCDPATLARDVAVALQRGWVLSGLRSFDAFPMTAHIESVAVLRPGAAG